MTERKDGLSGTRRRAPTGIFALVFALAAGCAAMGRVEEPSFSVETEERDFEVRRYAPRVVAETRIEGDWESAGSDGFRRLAGYIFGKNRGRREIPMTSPVGTKPEPVEIPMTAPVGMRGGGKVWTFAFTMPAGETLATLPAPDDERIVLREVPAVRVAVVRFSGTWAEERFQERTEALAAWMRERGLTPRGEPETNRFDPPWIPWFLRRNEVWWEIGG